jgi:hypothetical protein
MKYPLLLFAAVVLLSSCASLTGLQDGRTLGRDAGELAVSLNLSQTPDFDENITVDGFWAPMVEFGGRYGLSDRVDIGGRFNTNGNVALNGKVQLLGDREVSKSALALGVEFGSFGFKSGLLNVQIPLYFSVHPTPNFAWLLSPRYIRQFGVADENTTGINYMGANTGVLFGTRVRMGLEVGYFVASNGDGNTGLFQIGLGGRFAIGNKK